MKKVNCSRCPRTKVHLKKVCVAYIRWFRARTGSTLAGKYIGRQIWGTVDTEGGSFSRILSVIGIEIQLKLAKANMSD